ncbi:unnamed protein product [Prunus armeniaca]
MNSWTQQKGYPVISVKVKDQNLEFDQAQFYSSGSQGDGQWIVPITLCCGSYDVSKTFLLRKKSETIDIKEFLAAFPSAVALRNAIEKKHLSAADTFGILDDSFFLSMACQQSFASLLLISYKLAKIAGDAVPEQLNFGEVDFM